MPSVNSGVLVLPSRIAPAARARATTVASLPGTNVLRPSVPAVDTRPSVSKESLIVIGTPCSAPIFLPFASASSASRASYSARSKQVATTALILGLVASIRAMCSLMTSVAEICFSRIRRASFVADMNKGSSPLAMLVHAVFLATALVAASAGTTVKSERRDKAEAGMVLPRSKVSDSRRSDARYVPLRRARCHRATVVPPPARPAACRDRRSMSPRARCRQASRSH